MNVIAQKWIGGLLLTGGILGLLWIFLVKPSSDGMARLESAVTGQHLGPTAEEARHTELVGSILGVGAILAGGFLFQTANPSRR